VPPCATLQASLRMLQCYRDAALEDPLHSEEIMAHTHRYAVLLRLLAVSHAARRMPLMYCLPARPAPPMHFLGVA
jgi:hypothetical protein